MQAIQTKFLGPTDTCGSRIKATCWLKSVTVSWEYGLSSEENHRAAIDALVCRLNNDCIIKDNSRLWEVAAMGESADGNGRTAIIDLV